MKCSICKDSGRVWKTEIDDWTGQKIEYRADCECVDRAATRWFWTCIGIAALCMGLGVALCMAGL